MMNRVASPSTLALILALVATSACAPTVETRIASQGSAAMTAGTIARYDDQMVPQSEAQKQVSDALDAKGFRISDNGIYHLEVSWSARPADLALGSGTAPDDLAKAKSRIGGLFSGCAPTEYRLGVTLTAIADGRQDYHAIAAEYHCKTPEVAVLPALVKAAIADIGSPRGEHIEKRRL